MHLHLGPHLVSTHALIDREIEMTTLEGKPTRRVSSPKGYCHLLLLYNDSRSFKLRASSHMVPSPNMEAKSQLVSLK